MKLYPYRIAGEETVTHFPEHPDDLVGFDAFIRDNATTVLGLDTETKDLRIFSPGFYVRLVQIGTPTEAWVLRADLFADKIREVLALPNLRFVAHNAPFDLLALDRVGLSSLETLADRVFDTYILGHLCDPRTAQEGGTGLSLKALSSIYVDDTAPDTAEDLYAIFRKEYGATKKSGLGWSLIDINHPTYVTYAGLDVILVTRLLRELGSLVRGNCLTALATFEHGLQRVTTRMQRRGMLVDVPYVTGLRAELLEEQGRASDVAARYGVTSVNSPKQVSSALQGMGEVWTTKTDSGALSVGKDALLPMADLDKDWNRMEYRTPNPLATAVLQAKRAKKWGADYAQAFLDLRDSSDRIHPNIKTLAARTARMSVSSPPLQQLPSSDFTIRRGLIADPGNVIIAADYAQVEMRVLAAMADVKEMKAAILAGESIHLRTAALLWPDGYEKWQYGIAKNTGFAKVYGGGAATIAKTSGAPMDVVRSVVSAYDNAFPEIAAYGRKLQRAAEYGKGEVVTPIGRHLPLDRQRTYAATNYVVQSTARDLLGQALLDISAAGLEDHLLLPVHDEIVAQAPTADAEEIVRELGRLMESTFQGVPISSDPEVYGPSWGHGYGATS